MNPGTIRAQVLERLVGNRSEEAERWSRREIDEVMAEIEREAVAAAYGDDPASTVSARILRRRLEEAERIHQQVLAAGAQGPDGAEVVELGRRRAV